MSVKKKHARIGLLSAILFALILPQNLCAATDPKSPNMSMEEIQSKRREIREQLMLPSLSGIKSIGYRVVGFKDFAALEKAMGSKLKQLPIRTVPIMQMKVNEVCDAIAQITFVKTGMHTIAELKVTQWVSLDRDPKIHVKAVTYSEKAYLGKGHPEAAVNELTDQFVIDYLKANHKSFVIPGVNAASKGAKK